MGDGLSPLFLHLVRVQLGYSAAKLAQTISLSFRANMHFSANAGWLHTTEPLKELLVGSRTLARASSTYFSGVKDRKSVV